MIAYQVKQNASSESKQLTLTKRAYHLKSSSVQPVDQPKKLDSMARQLRLSLDFHASRCEQQQQTKYLKNMFVNKSENVINLQRPQQLLKDEQILIMKRSPLSNSPPVTYKSTPLPQQYKQSKSNSLNTVPKSGKYFVDQVRTEKSAPIDNYVKRIFQLQKKNSQDNSYSQASSPAQTMLSPATVKLLSHEVMAAKISRHVKKIVARHSEIQAAKQYNQEEKSKLSKKQNQIMLSLDAKTSMQPSQQQSLDHIPDSFQYTPHHKEQQQAESIQKQEDVTYEVQQTIELSKTFVPEAVTTQKTTLNHLNLNAIAQQSGATNDTQKRESYRLVSTGRSVKQKSQSLANIQPEDDQISNDQNISEEENDQYDQQEEDFQIKNLKAYLTKHRLSTNFEILKFDLKRTPSSKSQTVFTQRRQGPRTLTQLPSVLENDDGHGQDGFLFNQTPTNSQLPPIYRSQDSEQQKFSSSGFSQPVLSRKQSVRGTQLAARNFRQQNQQIQQQQPSNYDPHAAGALINAAVSSMVNFTSGSMTNLGAVTLSVAQLPGSQVGSLPTIASKAPSMMRVTQIFAQRAENNANIVANRQSGALSSSQRSIASVHPQSTSQNTIKPVREESNASNNNVSNKNIDNVLFPLSNLKRSIMEQIHSDSEQWEQSLRRLGLSKLTIYLHDICNAVQDACMKDAEFARNLRDFTHKHEDQFFFFLQKYLQYLCSQEKEILRGLAFFKMNPLMFEVIEQKLTEIVVGNNEGSGEASAWIQHIQADVRNNLVQAFSQSRQTLQPTQIIEYIGSQASMSKTVRVFVQLMSKTYLQERILGAYPDIERLVPLLSDFLNALLRDNDHSVQLQIEHFLSGELDAITNREMAYIKVCADNAIRQCLPLPDDVRLAILQKIEHLRQQLVPEAYTTSKAHDSEFYRRMGEGLRQLDGIQNRANIDLLAPSLIQYVFNVADIETRHLIKLVASCYRVVDKQLIGALQRTFQTALLDYKHVPRNLKLQLKHKFLQLGCAAGVLTKYSVFFRKHTEIFQRLEKWLNNRLEEKPLPFGYQMHHVYNLRGLQYLTNFYFSDYDTFSSLDVPIIIDEFTCAKKYIFKLQLLGLKHVLSHVNQLPKDKAKQIRDHFQERISESYTFTED